MIFDFLSVISKADGYTVPELRRQMGYPYMLALPQKLRESLLKGVGKRTTLENVFPLLFAAEPVIDPWGDTVREMIETGRRAVDEVLCNQAEACFTQSEWLEIVENDGAHFEDGERVEWIMKAILRGMNDKNCTILYQVRAAIIYVYIAYLILTSPLSLLSLYVLVQQIPVKSCYQQHHI